MNDLELTDNHIYKIRNRIIPGVTDTIQTNFGKRQYWSEWYANRGKAVHLAIHYLTLNQLDWESVDERIKPRIEAFQKFLAETGYLVLASEVPLFSKRYQFAGTLDLVMAKPGGKDLTIGDIKSSIEPIVDLQLGAYSLLYEENYIKIKKACAIELLDTGCYKLRWIEDLKRAQRTFLACLTVANWHNQNYNHNKEFYNG